MKKLSGFIIALLFPAAAAMAQVAQPQLIEKVEAASGSLNIPYEKWKLPNGLTLIIHEDHSDPIVNVSVVYHVGSARESIGKSGFAHFFEHMMFEGSDNVKDKEHFRIVSEAGGDMNGFTERDKTTYFETVPSNYLEVALWLEADRMGFLLDSVTKEKFEIQRETVKNEKAQNVENQPYAMAIYEIINQVLYPEGHPYSWPVIGYVDDLNRVSVDDLKNFFLRWYGPNNAVLTVSGDVKSKDVLPLVEKYFGSINTCPEMKKLKAPVPILATDQYANYVDNVYLPLTLMVYPTVPTYHRDEAALDFLADMIGEGNNSFFYKNFVKTEKAIEASASHPTSELSGEFQIQILPYPDMDLGGEQPASQAAMERKMNELVRKNFNETEKKVHETIDEFEKTGITEEAFQRVKSKKESQIIDQAEGVFGKGLMLANWHTSLGKQYNLSDELARYNNVTKEDVIRVFNKYIKDKHAAIVNVYPKNPMNKDSVKVKSYNPSAGATAADSAQYAGLKYVKAKDNFARSKRPSHAAPAVPVVPQIYTKKLSNGLNISGTKSAETPKVVLFMTMNGGDMVFASDLKKRGLSGLTAAMINEGTKNYTTEQISAELDKLGSSISFFSGKENTTVFVQCLTKNLDATLKLLEEKLMRPAFNADDFKRVKKQSVEGLRHQKKLPQLVASNIYTNLIYGDNILGSYATEKTMKKFTIDDVKSYYSSYYTPSGTNLVIVSELDEKEILPKLEFLGKWQAKEVKMPEVTGFPPAAKTQIYVADKDDAAQSVILVGNLGMKYDATGEFFKANVMNFALGGSFNSRLNLNLREDKGYTYGIYSGFSGSKYPGSFSVFASVKKTATDSCLTEILNELKNYSAGGLKDDEYTYTKSSLLNSEALRYETSFDKAGFLSQIAQYNLPLDFTKQQAKILNEISKEELNALAKKYIDPNKLIIVVVGNRYVLKDKLEKMGYGKIKDVEME
ncbi:MAG TPA: pitrilysin family protein [Bacteroidia bacterium]|nr:pitrilysin family protein [Bacteroidia bacterium]